MVGYLLCWWLADKAPWQDDTLYHRGLVLKGPQLLFKEIVVVMGCGQGEVNCR